MAENEKPATEANSGGVLGYVERFNLSHPNTMVVAKNQAELDYIAAYCDMNGFLPPWLGERENYPIALSPNGNGWTADMDRAVYYIRFKDFVSATT